MTGLVVVSTLAPSFSLAEPPVVSSKTSEAASDLRPMKAELRAGVLSAAIPELKAYREDLLALEKRLAAAEDFAGALKARNERTGLESRLASLEHESTILAARTTRAASDRISALVEFKLSDAKLDNIKLDQTDGSLVGWDQANASATWQMPFLPAGGYEVLLRCTGGPGEVVVKEGFYSLTGACKGSQDKVLDQNLGTLRIRAGGGTLTLTMAHPEKCTGWRVYSLVLVPPST